MGAREGKRISERLESLDYNKEFMMRVNAGVAWIGKVVKTFSKGNDRFTVIKNARPFHGVKEGVSDMIGFEVIEITSEMVGQKVAVFVAEEVKMTGGLTPEQKSFGEMVERLGGIFRVIR